MDPFPFDNNGVATLLVGFDKLLTGKFLNFQRDIDKNRVNNIYASYESEYLQRGDFIVFGSLLFAYFEDELYLLDGQHRFCALRKIYEQFQYVKTVTVMVYRCETKEQMFDYFKKINNNEIVPNWNLSKIDYVVLIKDSIDNISKQYSNYVTKKTTMIPKINLSDFFDLMVQYRLLYCYKLESVEEIVKLLEKWNRAVELSLQKHKNILKIAKRLEYFEKKNDNKQLYLSAITMKSWNAIFLNNIAIDEDVLLNV